MSDVFWHTPISGCQANRVLWAQICAGQKVSCNPRRMRSDCLRHHHDRAAWALLGAQPATLAEIIIELESVAGPELDHGIVGADPVAVVALEAVAAGEAPARLIERVGFIESLRDFLEGRAP